MKEFNKMLCLSNIYHLAKQRNIKIGDLETAAGVSAGYISRLNKPDTKTSPSIEMLAIVADRLDVSLDALLYHDYANLTPTEKYVVDFLEKLRSKTLSHDEIWRRETYSRLRRVGQDQRGNPEHPLYDWAKDEAGCTSIEYISYFREGERVVITDDGYVLPFDGNQSLYLMKVGVPVEMDDRGNTMETEYELYLVDSNWNVSIVCHSTCDEESPYNQPLEDLYTAAADSSKHPILTSNVRSAINNFMDAADLPF